MESSQAHEKVLRRGEPVNNALGPSIYNLRPHCTSPLKPQCDFVAGRYMVVPMKLEIGFPPAGSSSAKRDSDGFARSMSEKSDHEPPKHARNELARATAGPNLLQSLAE